MVEHSEFVEECCGRPHPAALKAKQAEEACSQLVRVRAVLVVL
jgi:hypothetical protein